MVYLRVWEVEDSFHGSVEVERKDFVPSDVKVEASLEAV